MGKLAEETIEFTFDEFSSYLRSKTRVFMKVNDHMYYLTHTDEYWRAQDAEKYNEKGHFADCSDLVSTLDELLGLAWLDGKTIEDVFTDATFYESIEE